MSTFLKFIYIGISVALLVACQQKKKPSPGAEEPVEVSDFIEFFPEVNTPFIIADSFLARKEKDSLAINTKVIKQFIPDSIISPVFGLNSKLKTHPLGRVESPEGETYLFAKMNAAPKKAIMVLVFDKKENFVTAMPVLRSDLGATTRWTTIMEKNYTLTKTIYKKNPDGSVREGKDIYAYSDEARNFMLIMTDAVGDNVTELVNPIDTFPRTHKFSADYTSAKTNLVSIRDGRKNDRLNFFIHFEKNNGTCTGELKGEALIRTSNMAEYRMAGDPCVLQFKFSSSGVTLTEIEGCGSRRGLRCTFDGNYPKKKVPKPKTTKSKSSKKK